MSSPSSGPDPLNPLAEEFVARYRRGERPGLTEYTDRYPELAEQIRALFPALVLMEQEGSVASPATGPDLRGATDGSLVPRQLGEYRVLREVGRGGMGVVYEAVQESLGRHVALKVLPLHGLASPTHRERFRREAKAAARLHHTNIVPVHGVGEDAGVCYYAMQFIQGQGLDVVLHELKRLRGDPEGPAAGGPTANQAVAAGVAQGLLTGRFQLAELEAGGAVLPPRPDSSPTPGSSPSELTSGTGAAYYRSVALIGVQVAEALAYAHQQGILHRDIKPSNLLLDTQGTVWITDFGLAKSDDSEVLTCPGDVVGTLRYLPPERLQGQSEARGDIYSLGLTLYELLTLEPAFVESNRARLIERVTHEDPPRPRQLDRHIPRDLETIVLKAIDKNPEGRYATASALAEDLRRFLADRPIQARRTSAVERLGRWCRRNPALASTLALAVTALSAATLLSIAFAIAQARSNIELTGAYTKIDQERQLTQAALDKSELQAAELALDKGQLLGEQGDANRALLWLAHSLKRAPADAHDLQRVIRQNLDAWRSQVYSLRRILLHKAMVVGAVAFDPEGKSFLTLTRWPALALRRWQLPSGLPADELPPLDAPDRAWVGIFSPDRRTLLLGWGDGSVRLLDVATGKCQWHQQLPGLIVAAAFSPDGKTALVGCSGSPNREDTPEGWAQLVDVATGAVAGPALRHDRPVTAVAFSPDGQIFVTESGLRDPNAKGRQQLWDTRGQPLGPPQEYVPGALSVTFSPNGEQLWTGHWDCTARLWDVATRKPVRSLLTNGPVSDFAFRPGGKALLIGSYGQSAQVWDPATGVPLSPALLHDKPVYSVAFSPDGKFLLTSGQDYTARLWEAATDTAVGPAWAPGEMAFPLAASRDGKTLLVAEADGAVWLRDAVTGQPLRGPLRHPGRVGAGAFSPDCTRAVTVAPDFTARLWNVAEGAALAELKPRQWPKVTAVAFSPDGTQVVTGCWGGRGGTAWLWDAATGQKGQQLHTDPAGPVFAVAFSPDGRTILTAGANGLARRWDAATRRPLGEPLAHGSHIATAAFSPDGQTFLTGGADNCVQRWDAATGKRLGRLLEHPSWVLTVAYSPDGKTLLTGCRDGKARLWDTATGKRLGRPLSQPGWVSRVAFWYDGKAVLTAATDSLGQFAGTETSAQFWRVPASLGGDARQLELWVQVLTGMELEADGAARLLNASTWEQRRQQLQDSGFQGP
jgi:WD40 repeat protein/serine/threonine protein kinase